MHRSYGLQHLRHKRPTFAFTSESGYTLGFRRRIAHKGSHAETGAIQMGALLLPSDCFTRFGNLRGQGVERQTLPLLGLGRGCSQRTQRACGTAMRLCASLSRGVAAPLGCVIFFASAELRFVHPALRAFCVCETWEVSLPSACSSCCWNAGRPLVKAANLPFSCVPYVITAPILYFSLKNFSAILT